MKYTINVINICKHTIEHAFRINP